MKSRADARGSGPFGPGELARWITRAGITLFGVTLATFFLLQMIPGDPARVRVHAHESVRVAPEAYEAMRRQMGLDRPVPVQYFSWVGGLLRGDLGTSLADGRPVTERIAERLPASVLLNSLALAVVFAVAVPFGTLLARRRGSPLDRGSRHALFLLFALPSFWIAVLLQAALAVHLGWLPMHGMGSTGIESAGPLFRAFDLGWHLVLPVLCLAYGQIAFLTRFTRANVLESLGQDFVRTARAKGLPEGTVLRRHAFRTALLPLLTLSGLTLPALVGGSILIETIFSWPGLGSLFFDSVSRRDYPLVMALTLLTAVLTLAGNLTADLLYRVADPRAAP